MSQTLEKVGNAELLDAIYKNVKMASDSITSLLPHVENEKMQSDLVAQLSCFEEYAARAAKYLEDYGRVPKEESFAAKAGAKVGTFFQTLVDSSTDHLADMMIKGANMGVNDLYREIRAAKEGGADREILSFAEEVCRYEDKVLEEMRSYLN